MFHQTAEHPKRVEVGHAPDPVHAQLTLWRLDIVCPSHSNHFRPCSLECGARCDPSATQAWLFQPQRVCLGAHQLVVT